MFIRSLLPLHLYVDLSSLHKTIRISWTEVCVCVCVCMCVCVCVCECANVCRWNRKCTNLMHVLLATLILMYLVPFHTGIPGKLERGSSEMLREELRRIYGLPEQHYKLYEDPGQNVM